MRVAHLSVYALAGVALVGWMEAQAAVCVKKNKKGVIKTVTIRQACAKKETVVPASDLLQQGPHVVDSGGKEVGALVGRDTVLRQIGNQVVTFNVNNKGISTPVDDASYGFTYQGSQCSGTRYSDGSAPPVVGDDDLSIDLSVSADGKTGYYVMRSELTKLSGAFAQASLESECVTPPGTPIPPTAQCPSGETALGAASACDPKKLGEFDPMTQCSCIRCCRTFTVTSPSVVQLYPVHTVDLSGVGSSPFKIER